MSRTKLCMIDGTLMLPIPTEILAQLGLAEGSNLMLSIEGGCLSIKPLPRYSLHELMAECDPFPKLTEEDRQWLDAPPKGRELW